MLRVICTICVLAATISGAQAQTVAVFTAQNPDPKAQAAYGQQITDSMVNVLRKFKRFTIVERSQTGNVIAEMKFQSSSLVDDKTAVALGQQSGAQLVALSSFLISGNKNVSNYTDKNGRTYTSVSYNLGLNVNARLVDVKTGEITFATQVPASASGPEETPLISAALVDFERKLERGLTAQFPNVGYVIKMLSPTEYMIDVGATAGVAMKDAFVVYVAGNDIVHPVTGKVIKGDDRVIAEGVVSSVSEEAATIKLSKKPAEPIEIGSAKVKSMPKKKGFMESLNDFSKGVN